MLPVRGFLTRAALSKTTCLGAVALWEHVLQEEVGAGAVGDNGVASEAAVRSAIAELDRNDIARAKVALAAQLILQRHPRLAHISARDLVQEALLRTLQARRKWRPAQIGFLGHVIGAMRSIASAATKSASRGTVQAEPLEVITDDGEAREVVALEPTPSVEDILIATEERAIGEARLDAFYQELANDKEATAVYERLCEGMPKRDVRAALGMSDKEFWTVDRRLSRLIDRLFKPA